MPGNWALNVRQALVAYPGALPVRTEKTLAPRWGGRRLRKAGDGGE